MADVVIGNVILTAALAAALLLFVASAMGISLLYTIKSRDTLLKGSAELIAQIIQQTYLVVNNSQIRLGTNFTEYPALPSQIDGYEYTITATTTPLHLGATTDTSVILLTVTLKLVGTVGQANATILVGSNLYWYTKTPVDGAQNLGILIDKCSNTSPNHPICRGTDILGAAFILNSKVLS
ncbi:MAG: hypothetical protein QW429_07050 [Thermoprotei archaeon]